jgi:hypothetical protein
MSMHDEWTDKLSDYLDGELTPREQAAVESHLQGCAACASVLEELKRVVAQARAITPRPPAANLWDGIAARIEAGRGASRVFAFPPQTGRRFAFSLPQLAAASLLIAAVSGGAVWSLANRAETDRTDAGRSANGHPTAQSPRGGDPVASRSIDPGASRSTEPDTSLEPVSLADAQYDAAVADLEGALKQGRGRLDASTIAIVEHNLQTIDEAIQQAREALASDPANTYLSSHLIEARRRKLDLLRRATALTSEMD